MDRTIADALRRAAAMTRAGLPLDATRAIQAALGIPAGSSSRPPEGQDGGLPLAGADFLDLTATRIDPDRPEGGAPRAEATAGPEATVRKGRARVVRPLADTIRDLAAVRRAAGSQGTLRAGPPPVPDGARYVSRSFDTASGRREYRLYVPADAAAGRATGLVMMLHGCQQDPDDFATGTGMNAAADAAGMIVVYPAQTAAANASLCWNWFNAADQRRGCGEAALLAALATAVAVEFAVPPGAIFVAGLSAGGAMAAVLADAYPDVFAAAGIHSGLPAGAARDMPTAFAAMAGHGLTAGRTPSPTSAIPLIVFHGTADTVVHPANGDAIVEAARHRAPARDRHEGRTASGRTFRRIVYRTVRDEADAEHWILDGHGHAWSGGNPAGSFTDPDGPNASAEMVRFFQAAASGEGGGGSPGKVGFARASGDPRRRSAE